MAPLYPNLWTYVSQALGAEAEQAAVRKPIQFRSYDEQERLELTPPLDLRLR